MLIRVLLLSVLRLVCVQQTNLHCLQPNRNLDCLNQSTLEPTARNLKHLLSSSLSLRIGANWCVLLLLSRFVNVHIKLKFTNFYWVQCRNPRDLLCHQLSLVQVQCLRHYFCVIRLIQIRLKGCGNFALLLFVIPMVLVPFGRCIWNYLFSLEVLLERIG